MKWLFRTLQIENFNEILNNIPEREYILQFIQKDDQLLALVSILLKRKFINQYTKWHGELMVDENKRPFHPGCPDFNVSHHSGIVVLASVNEGRVGVDVVNCQLPTWAIGDWIDGFNEVFTLHELHVIKKFSDKSRMFHAHWALKEAYVKAIGTGLITNLLEIEFRNVQVPASGDKYNDVECYIKNIKSNYCFELYALDGDILIASAFQQRDASDWVELESWQLHV